jgi:hypothetical protein
MGDLGEEERFSKLGNNYLAITDIIIELVAVVAMPYIY